MFTTLKTITLGVGPREAALHLKLLRGGFVVGDWAEDMLLHPTFPWQERPFAVELVQASGEDLGFTGDKVHYGDICKAFVSQGFELCPQETGPRLRMEYPDQPPNVWLMLAMPPVFDSVGTPSIFFLGRGSGGLWLGASRGHPKVKLSTKAKFVACRRL